jgi:hypothetical protein
MVAMMKAILTRVRFCYEYRACLDLHGLTACPATAYSYSVLSLRIAVPVRSKPLYMSIGLAGDGMMPRTMLYSLRAA